MSLSKSSTKNVEGIVVSDDETLAKKANNSLIVRIDQDSDNNLQALFDSVLNPSDSKRPLQVPFRMRKLPNSFFNPPAVNARPTSGTHSRTNSADSAYESGFQPNLNQGATSILPTSTSTAVSPKMQSVPRITINHSRAHSSPASLQLSYSFNSGNIGDNEVCAQNESGSTFPPAMVGFPPTVNEISTVGLDRTSQFMDMNSTQTFHMKQRSYDVISPIQLQNELGDLPPGWEQAKTNDGQIYYLNHTTKTTQWEDPRIHFKQQRILQSAFNQNVNEKNKEPVLTDSLGLLPEGWEQAFTETGDVYFINHINRTTSWNDPRIPEFLQKSVKTPKSEMNWVNVRQPEKRQELFKHKPEQNALTRLSSNLQMDPFLSGDNHARQESSDSGLSLSSNSFSMNSEFIPQIEDSMDCISENGTLNALNGLDCPDNLVSSLQLEDNICDEMFSDVHNILNSAPSKPDNLEWYKIN